MAAGSEGGEEELAEQRPGAAAEERPGGPGEAEELPEQSSSGGIEQFTSCLPRPSLKAVWPEFFIVMKWP